MTDDERRARWGAARAKFLRELEATGEVRSSADAARLDHRDLYAAKRADADFAREWNAAFAAWKHARVAAIKKSDDWHAHLALLERAERRREGALKRGLLRAQTRALTMRADGTLPAEKIELNASADDDLLERLTRLAAGRGRAGGGADGG